MIRLILGLLGALLAVAVVLVVGLYLVAGRLQLFLTTFQQILAALQQLLPEVPGKTAQRTMADVDVEPRPWFPQLRRLAELRDHVLAHVSPVFEDDDPDVDDPGDDAGPVDPTDVELARWAEDGGADRADPDLDAVDAVDAPPAVLGPATRPAQQVVLELAGVDPEAAAATGTEPDLDAVDRYLMARFNLTEGRRP
jgi:hypothetical protein